MSWRTIDLELSTQTDELTNQLLAELIAPSTTSVVYRGNQRWLPTFEPIRLDEVDPLTVLRPRGIYLIVGGLVGPGYALAAYLAQTVQARLILIEQTSPDPNESLDHAQHALESLGAEVTRYHCALLACHSALSLLS